MDEVLNYRTRTLEGFFSKAEGQFPVMIVTGPRQIGKTTFLRHLAGEKRKYVTLDDPLLCSLAREEPGLFLQRFAPPVLIDEIQYAPQLLPHIKMMVDNNREAGQFWLTGSQQFHLMKGVSESLAGRVGVLNLLGFSKRELNGDADAKPFISVYESLLKRESSSVDSLSLVYKQIWLGSFPALYQEVPADRELFYSSYVQTYLQRDVRDLANVGDESSFLRFLRACAGRTGQLLNIHNLCEDSDINHATGKRWLSILQNSGIVYLLEPFHSNFNKRLVKTPKLYFLDTGLAAWLTEWSSPSTLEAGAMSGAFLETWIVSEVIKSFWHNGKRAPIFYYRDKDKKEIDLLIYQDGTIYPVEIKKTGAPTKKSIKHFSVLKTLNLPIGDGCIIAFVPSMIPITSKVQAVPVSMI